MLYPTDVADLDGASNTTTIATVAALAGIPSPQNVTCFGANDGTITVTSQSGGYGTYEYSKDGGTTWQSSPTFSGLAPGPGYNVQIRDAAHTGCVLDIDGSGNTPITEPTILAATSLTIVNASTVGGTDGSITVNSPSGGSGSYEYSKDGGVTWQSSNIFTGLQGGATYNVFIRDANHTGCMIDLDGSSDTPIAQPPAPVSGTITATNPTCFGVSDGTITVTSPAGGYGTYEYSKDGGTTWQTSGSFTGLADGTYNIQIRDAAYPTDVADLDGSTNTPITQPSVLSGSITSTRVTSNGASDGTITISSPQGGNGTYQYSIDGGTTWQPSGSFTSLPAATYNVEIRDGANIGCIIDLDGSVDTPIIQPSGPLAASTGSTNVTCFGSNDGTITVSSPSGGYGNYEYSKDGGTTWQASGSFSGLMPNVVYDVQIRDKDQPTDVLDLGNTTLTEPVVLSGTISAVNPTCNNGTDGSITINSAAGGSSTYEFSIDGGTTWQSLPTFQGLAEKATNYNVLIRDQAHTTCVIDLDGSTNTILTSPSPISATAALSKETCKGSDGAIDLAVSGGTPLAGTPSYTYEWSNGFITEDISTLGEGTYSVTIKDANQCSITQEFVIDLDCVLRVYQAVSPNGDGKNDYWRIDRIEQFPGNTVRLFDRFNNLVYETHGYTNETNNWTGQANHGLTRGTLPDDTYFYWVDLGSGLGKLSGFVILKNH
jgi:gliding motility-associated-like protein